MTAAASPIDRERFRAALKPLLAGPDLALGVSGGSDSLGLVLLAAEAREALDLQLHALTVDHGLRAESGAEAARVGEICAGLDIPHTVLTWRGEKPASNLQAAARDARYALMRAWRRAHDVRTLAVAHTQDDLAETFLMRLARGSGVDGLSAMAPLREEGGGLRLIRPLLSVTRADLQAVCRARGVAWIEDPSNEDPRFDRVRARQALAALAPLGLDRERLAKTARHMRRARTALEGATEALLADATLEEDREIGWRRLRIAPLHAAPEELGLRAFAAVLRATAGADYPPRFDTLEAAFEALQAPVGGRTLHGCLLDWSEGLLTFCREPAAVAPPARLTRESETVWDGRWSVAAAEEGLTVGALGEAGLAALRQLQDEAVITAPGNWRRAPRAARLSAPGLWRGDALFAAPAAGLRGEAATISPLWEAAG